jgi:regulator of RNase E activity RraB
MFKSIYYKFKANREKREREALDLDTIKALKNAGSDLSKPHYIEHHFTVIDKCNIAKITEILKNKGYEVSEVYEEIDKSGRKYFFFDGCKYCLVEPKIIFQESKEMSELAISFNEVYDGWGTKVE